MMRRVLVVDDEANVRLTISEALARPDLEVRTAASGEEALEIAETVRFDLVLLDLRMPGMDGMGVLKKMKQSWPESEVVIITGYPSVDSAKEAVRLGASDYLSKPLGPDEIVGAAREAITRKQWTLRQNLTRSIR